MRASPECLRTDAVARRNLRIRVRSPVMLRVTLAPKARSVGALANRQTIGARRGDLLPRRDRLRAANEHRARGVPNQALGHRAEHDAVEPRAAVRTDDDD